MQNLTPNKAKSKTYKTIPTYSLKLIKNRSIRYPVRVLSNPSLAAEAMQAYLGDRDCEHISVLMLDNQNNNLGLAIVAIGTIGGTGAAVRDVFKHAIAGRASAIILGHNHPSNDVLPSKEDIEFTKKVDEAGKVLGIPVVDHIIVSSGINEKSYSFLNNGMMGD